MSLIGTAIGALVALLPRPVKPVQIPVESEVERLKQVIDGLNRSHARLLDHIETLEREFLLEQHICAHWKEEAERLAYHSRAERERRERDHLAAQALQQNPLPPPNWAEMNRRSAMAYAQAQQNLANQQAQLAQYAGQAQGLQGAYEGFCNCVPSRAQVWGAAREGDR
jgi:hypothetical protein